MSFFYRGRGGDSGFGFFAALPEFLFALGVIVAFIAGVVAACSG